MNYFNNIALSVASLVFLTIVVARAEDDANFCLTRISDNIRNHTPRSTNLGVAVVDIYFHVNKGGSLSKINVSSSSPKHAEVARRIIASSHGPKSCGDHDINTSLTFN